MLGDVLLQRLTEQAPFCALFRATAENLLAAPFMEALLERTAHGQGTKELTLALRADAYTRMCNYFRIPDFTAGLRSSGTKELAELANVVELFHYNNPDLIFKAHLQGPARNPQAITDTFNEVFGG